MMLFELNGLQNHHKIINFQDDPGRLPHFLRVDGLRKDAKVIFLGNSRNVVFHRSGELLESLTYTKADQEAGVSPQHTIPIDGNILNGTASLRNAVKLYLQLCLDGQRGKYKKTIKQMINYTYVGEYIVVEKPFSEQGKWIFPYQKSERIGKRGKNWQTQHKRQALKGNFSKNEISRLGPSLLHFAGF